MSTKLFVSYRVDEEGTMYKNLLVAWSKNDNGFFDIKFNDTSVGVSINSTNADYIKSVIKSRIKEAPVFLCLVGENTHKSQWVNWEIQQAYDLGKKIVAVKIKNSYITPTNLYNVNASWAKTFKYDSIKNAIEY